MKKQTLKKLDISPETADLRLREMSALYKLGISMKGAKWMGKVTDGSKSQQSQRAVDSGSSAENVNEDEV
ncbi:MAG: hypothetical protein QF437_04395 [Planctomycetota bacterium]|nr:hypothetical protein [Planctomycetota bacterium]MDP7129701.1 hypothetical protein [Planctomycetota bacterium]MDP7255262.1 hypothetical protein [Planctomycetota bacterium]